MISVKMIQEMVDVQSDEVFKEAKRLGFSQKRDKVFFKKQTTPVITLTKEESLKGLDLILQYVVNPKTESWVLRACLVGQTAEDMIEFRRGEDYNTLLKDLNRKNKITPSQALSNLNTPIGVDLEQEYKNA